MELLAAVGLPAELGGELAISVFEFALADWQQVASGIKLAMHIQPNCTPKFYKYPSITVIRRFWPAAVYAYVQAAQSGDVKVSAGLEMLATPASWKLLDATDPLKVPPAKPAAAKPAAKPKLLAEMAAKEAANAKLLAKMADEAPF